MSKQKNNSSPKRKLMPKNDSPRGEMLKPWYPALATNPNDNLPSSPTANYSPMSPAETETAVNHLIELTNLIEQHTPQVDEKDYKGKTGITLRNQQYLLNAIQFIQDHPDMRPHNINITDWLNDMANYNGLMYLYGLIDRLKKLCYKAFRIFSVSAWKKFKSFYKYIALLAKEGDPRAQELYDQLSQYYAWAKGNKRAANNTDEDMSMDIDTMNQLIRENNRKIDAFLENEKRIKQEIRDDIIEKK